MTLPGNRKLLPSPGYSRIVSDAQLAGFELTDGQALPVSTAAEARLRWNAATGKLEMSLNGAAYVEVAAGGVAGLVTSLLSGSVNAFGADPNVHMVFDGVTPGGVPTSVFAIEQPLGVFRPDDPAYGAVGDLQTVTDGTTGAGDATVTSPSNPWTADDVGKTVRIRGAGAAGADHLTTWAAYNGPGSMEMTDAAVTAVAGTATIDWATDDGPAIQLALDAAKAAGGGIVMLARKRYAVLQNLGLTSATDVTVEGCGMGASSIEDLRVDGDAGLPTGTYRATLSFLGCERIFVRKLSLVGCIDVADIGDPYVSTPGIARMGVWHYDSNDCVTEYVRVTRFHDEAIATSGNCSGWICDHCLIEWNLGNGINPGMASGVGPAAIMTANKCRNNGLSGLIFACDSFVCLGNIIHNAGLVGTSLSGDLVVIDTSCRGVFANNVIHDSESSFQGVSPISVFGTARVGASLIIEGNLITGIDGYWNTAADAGAAIKIKGHAGSVTIRNNTIDHCGPSRDFDHTAIRVHDAAATALVTIGGNTLRNNGTGWLRTAIYTTGGAAGAIVRVGRNELIDFVTEYSDNDGTIQFDGSAYSDQRELTHVGSPHASLVSDFIVAIDSTGGIVTYKLPDPAAFAGRDFYIGDDGQNASANAITIDANTDGGTTINGVNTVAITTDGGGAWVHCDGTVYKTRGSTL